MTKRSVQAQPGQVLAVFKRDAETGVETVDEQPIVAWSWESGTVKAVTPHGVYKLGESYGAIYALKCKDEYDSGLFKKPCDADTLWGLLRWNEEEARLRESITTVLR